jgi:type 2 lantibiotic biosynthesis protein LanM
MRQKQSLVVSEAGPLCRGTRASTRAGADMAEIVARARPLAERIQEARDRTPERPDAASLRSVGPSAPELVERRLRAWCRAATGGDWDAFQRRLAWDGLNLDGARRLLAPDQPSPPGSDGPPWAGFLDDVVLLSGMSHGAAGTLGCVRGTRGEPVPFQEILAAFVAVARRRIDDAAGETADLLSAEAHAALDRGLLRTLAAHAAPTLYFEFALRRAQSRSSLDQLLAAADEAAHRDVYDRFVAPLRGPGLLPLFKEYPPLARLLSTIALRHTGATLELLRRLAADRDEIRRVLAGGREMGTVVAVRPGLSDPHRGQRRVAVLTFASGLEIVYKPRDLGAELHFNRLLRWLSTHGAPLPLRALRVLCRPTHGWVEHAGRAPCADRAAARRYYQRAGMLLCLIYVLEGTDCHCQNIVASGEHPVLVDGEALLHHRWRAHAFDLASVRTVAIERTSHSVLRTGLLPSWAVSRDGRAALDLGGLDGGGRDPDSLVLGWRDVNTDRMVIEYQAPAPGDRRNVPIIEGAPGRLADYESDVIRGFRAMHALLRARREALLENGNPLHDLLRQRVRHVCRDTRLYRRVQARALEPGEMRDGADRGIQLEALARGLVASHERPRDWAMLAEEQQALEHGDLPFSTARADGDALELADGRRIDGVLAGPSAAIVRARLTGLDERDLALQVGLIHGILRVGRTGTTGAPDQVVAVQVPSADRALKTPHGTTALRPDGLIAAAARIADEIRARAIEGPDRSVVWISPTLPVETGRYDLDLIGDGLYDGAAGIGLLFAALAAVTRRAGDRNWALRSITALRAAARARAAHLGQGRIGAASGLGGIVYALVRIGGLLGEPAILDEATAAAAMLTDDRIADDRSLDVMAGSAGAALGLLALHSATGARDALGRAMACGRRLLATRTRDGAGPRAWMTLGGRRLLGFSHGAAGIAYALARLYERTLEPTLRDAAAEAVAYEDALFSDAHGNWPDLRTGPDVYLAQWCHGATGIGLARLGGLAVVDGPRIRLDIEAAVEATRRAGLDAGDSLCCGAMGRLELLLEAGRTLGRPDFVTLAIEWASSIVARARREGGYRTYPSILGSVCCPGLFQGTAGVGYELLRLADPDMVPSVLLWR